MSMHEFRRWQAFDQEEPIGDHRLEILLGHAVAHLVLVQSGANSIDPKEYMPILKDYAVPTPQSGEEMMQVFERAAKRKRAPANGS